MADDGYCTKFHSTFPGTNKDTLTIVGAGLYFLMGLCTLSFIQYGKYAVKKVGEDGKVKSILFPVFELILYAEVAISIYTGVVIILVPINPGESNEDLAAVVFASVWSLQHGIIEGLAILLFQNGCGRYALKRSLIVSSVWCLISFILYFVFFEGDQNNIYSQLFIDLLLLFYYGGLYFLPQHIRHRRPSLMIYAKYWLIFRILVTILHSMYFVINKDTCSCAYYFVRIVLFCLFQPILSYEVMLLDSEWWQGISPSPRHLPNRSSTTSVESNEFTLSSAQTLAEVMDQLNVLDGIFLNAATVSYNKHSLLGDGSFSKVVKGTYQSSPVAIKTIYTQDLTVNIIHKIASETKILCLLKKSPHVVLIHGILLSPPSICIVLELCQFGSLNNVLRGYEISSSNQPLSGSSKSTGLFSTSMMRTQVTTCYPPLVLSVPDLLFLALGSARGVHAVHGFNSSLCHRDIKSFNFLVSSSFVVKIADLELGDDSNSDEETLTSCRHCFGLKKSEVRSAESSFLEEGLLPMQIGHDSRMTLDDPSELTHFVHPSIILMQATWLAPEVMRTGIFSQASDIYSLALVLWEIRTKRYPYSHCNHFQTKIRQTVLSGFRETFPVIPEHDIYETVLREYDKIINISWDNDPKKRPKSFDIVARLEELVKYCFVWSLRSVLEIQCRNEKKLVMKGGQTSAFVPIKVGISEERCEHDADPCEDVEYEMSPNISLSSPLNLSVFHLHQLLESHGSDWVIVSSSSPHHVLFITTSWKRSYHKLVPSLHLKAFEELCRGGIAFSHLLSSLSMSLSSSTLPTFYKSSMISGYGHCLLNAPIVSHQTVALHGYRVNEHSLAYIYQVPVSSITQPFTSIALCFSNLTPHLEELSPLVGNSSSSQNRAWGSLVFPTFTQGGPQESTSPSLQDEDPDAFVSIPFSDASTIGI